MFSELGSAVTGFKDICRLGNGSVIFAYGTEVICSSPGLELIWGTHFLSRVSSGNRAETPRWAKLGMVIWNLE